jgi:hypothetical protein
MKHGTIGIDGVGERKNNVQSFLWFLSNMMKALVLFTKAQLEKKAVEIVEAAKEWGRWFLEQVRDFFDLFWRRK